MKLKKALQKSNSDGFFMIKEALDHLDLWQDFLHFFDCIDVEEMPDCSDLEDYSALEIEQEYNRRNINPEGLSLTQKMFLEEQQQKIEDGEII